METIILRDNEVLDGTILESFKNPEVLIKVEGDNVRIVDCRFFHPRNDFEALIRVDGKNCIIDNCVFAEFDVNGCCIVLSRKERLDTPDNLVVKNCLFMNGRDTKKNGAEAIRLGWSGSSLTGVSHSIIRDNRFENWSREIEIISVKSSYNIVFNNEFMGCQGTITLRHGRNNLVAHNIIDGKGKKKTGGIRVIDTGHSILHNILKDINGDNRNRTGVSLINGKELTRINGYYAINSCLVTENMFINCNTAIALGYAIKKNKMLPNDVIIDGNTFDHCEEIFSSNKECLGLRNKSICENVCMSCEGAYKHKEVRGIRHTDQVWYKLHLFKPKGMVLDSYEGLKDSILNYKRPFEAYGTHGIVPPPTTPPPDVPPPKKKKDNRPLNEIMREYVKKLIENNERLIELLDSNILLI